MWYLKINYSYFCGTRNTFETCIRRNLLSVKVLFLPVLWPFQLPMRLFYRCACVYSKNWSVKIRILESKMIDILNVIGMVSQINHITVVHQLG